MTTPLDSTRTASYGPLALRIALGIVFVAHAYAKAAIFTFPGTEQFFVAHGFPAWTVYPVFAAELAGGLALIAGFRVRWVAPLLVPVMLGALKTHLDNGWSFMATGGGWEYPAFLIAALGAQWAIGPGALALDNLRVRTALTAVAAH
ncbi:DoxX family protein [soil metagenome]